MGKTRIAYACTACGAATGQWAGRCPACGAWGSVEERSASPPGAGAGRAPEPVPLGLAGEAEERLGTGFAGMDRVLGGGLVRGSVVLLAGEPGIGKSTLLLQVLARLSGDGHRGLLASGEESSAQVGARARRLGLGPEGASYVPGRDLLEVVGAAEDAAPDVLVVDSIQSIRHAEHAGLPGGAAQVRLCADRLVGLAKEHGVAVILAGQVTKDGEVAGPRTLEHAVDAVCSFDGDARTGLRVLAGGKNRFGPEGELAWFEMGPRGLAEADPTALLVGEQGSPGAALALMVAGRRAVALEIQALLGGAEGPPRRHVTGLDPKRFGLVAAVVDRRGGSRLGASELFGATAGGVRVDDPGCDLAVAAALASAASGVPPPRGVAFAGEVSLTGTVRPAPNMPARLAAASSAGIEAVYCAGDVPGRSGVRIVGVRRLAEALDWAREGGSGRNGRVKVGPRRGAESASGEGDHAG
jgi:DNA repair protein RadA/Sms